MKLLITIDLDEGSAFYDDGSHFPNPEISRILRGYAEDIDNEQVRGMKQKHQIEMLGQSLHDINGNLVGRAQVQEDEITRVRKQMLEIAREVSPESMEKSCYYFESSVPEGCEVLYLYLQTGGGTIARIEHHDEPYIHDFDSIRGFIGSCQTIDDDGVAHGEESEFGFSGSSVDEVISSFQANRFAAIANLSSEPEDS